MKYFVLLGAAALVLLSCTPFKNGQRNHSFENLVNQWVEGQIEDETGKVIPAALRRGGWVSFEVNEDKTVRFNGPKNCGFGSAKEGTWSADSDTGILTFEFSKEVGYMNNKDAAGDIEQVERYKIAKLTENELIMQEIGTESERMWAFLTRTEK